MDANEIIERRACITRRRAVRDRPAPVPRSAGAHARRLPRRDRATPGSRPPTSTGCRRTRDRWARRPGFSGAGAYDVIDALRLNCGWYGSGLETSGQLGSVINACLAVGVGAREPRAVLPLGVRRLGAGRQGPRRRSCPAVAAVAAAFKASRVHGVEPRRSPRRRPRSGSRCSRSAHFHKYGTTREQLAWIALERAPQRGAEPEGDLPRSDVDRRLHGVAHDLDAVLPVRLRRARATARPR